VIVVVSVAAVVRQEQVRRQVPEEVY
jgi:hypothetical protein